MPVRFDRARPPIAEDLVVRGFGAIRTRLILRPAAGPKQGPGPGRVANATRQDADEALLNVPDTDPSLL